MIEHDIGCIFTYNYDGISVKLKAIESKNDESCEGCYFFKRNDICPVFNRFNCSGLSRDDEIYIIYQEIKEK